MPHADENKSAAWTSSDHALLRSGMGRLPREYVVPALAVAWVWFGWPRRAHATEEDVVIDYAMADLKCDDLRLVHAANHYYVAGCGKRRKYECAAGKCVDMTNVKEPGAAIPSAGCVAAVSATVGYAGCACLYLIGGSRSPPPPPPDVPPGACADRRSRVVSSRATPSAPRGAPSNGSDTPSSRRKKRSSRWNRRTKSAHEKTLCSRTELTRRRWSGWRLQKVRPPRLSLRRRTGAACSDAGISD